MPFITGSPTLAHFEANVSKTISYIIPAEIGRVFYVGMICGEYVTPGKFTATLTTPKGLTLSVTFYPQYYTTFGIPFNFSYDVLPQPGIAAEIIAARGSSISLTFTMGPTCPNAMSGGVIGTGFDTYVSQIYWDSQGAPPPTIRVRSEMDMAQDHASGLITIIRSVAA